MSIYWLILGLLATWRVTHFFQAAPGAKTFIAYGKELLEGACPASP